MRGLARETPDAWLHRGVPRREWIWPPDHRGVRLQRNPGYENA
jgi:hypothetical protein